MRCIHQIVTARKKFLLDWFRSIEFSLPHRPIEIEAIKIRLLARISSFTLKKAIDLLLAQKFANSQ